MIDRKTTWKTVGLWSATVLATLAFLIAGGSKLAGASQHVEAFARWGYPGWFLYVVGACEIAGALLLVVPRTATFGAFVLGCLMLGAIGTHLRAGEGPHTLAPLLLLGLVALVGWARRGALIQLVQYKFEHASGHPAR